MLGGINGAYGAAGATPIYPFHHHKHAPEVGGSKAAQSPASTLDISPQGTSAADLVGSLQTGQGVSGTSSPAPGGVPMFNGAMAVSRAS